MSFSFGVTDTDTGQRFSAEVGRSYATPRTAFSGRIGATRGVTGEVYLSGSVTAARELPRGNLSLDLARAVVSGNEQNNEQVITSLRFGYLQNLTPLSNLGFAVDFADATVNTSGLSTTNASLTATYSRTLTPDWSMDLGLRHRYRDESTIGPASSNELFLSLGRDFVTRF